jgi:non-ribosomal peptide synthetase component F
MLAIMKIGAVYIPLDPMYPPDRCAAMMEDAKARALVTIRDLGAALMSKLGDVVVLVELDVKLTQKYRGSDVPSSPYDEDDLAYCIFTSGSTGRPKGVPIYHRSLINLLKAFQEEVWTDW